MPVTNRHMVTDKGSARKPRPTLRPPTEFLAAVQVIVYAGAIVVLFLFVIMLIGVDRTDDLSTEPLVGQRQLAVVAGALLAAGLAAVVLVGSITGKPA